MGPNSSSRFQGNSASPVSGPGTLTSYRSPARPSTGEADFAPLPKAHKLRDRLLIVRMAHRGRAHQDIAADLGVHLKTVTGLPPAAITRSKASSEP